MELRELPGDLRDGALAVLDRPEPVAQALEPDLDRGQRRLRVAGREGALEVDEPSLDRREPREDRLDGGVLLGVEAGELAGDLRHRALAVLQRPEPVAEAIEAGLDRGQRRLRVASRQLGEPGLQRREPREDRLDRGVLLGVELRQLPGDLRDGALAVLQRPEPVAKAFEAGLDAGQRRLRVAGRQLGQPGLQRREPREDRLDGGVLLGIEPGQLPGDLGEGVLGALDRREPALQRLQPLGEAVEKRARVALGQPLLHLGEPGLERRQAGQHRLDAGVLLGVEPGELVGDPGERALAGVLQRRDPALHRFQPLGEAVEKRARVALGQPLLHLGEPGLERRQAGQHRLDAGVLLGVEPGQLLGDRREGGLGRVLQRGRAARPAGRAPAAGRGRGARSRARRCGWRAGSPAPPSGRAAGRAARRAPAPGRRPRP